MINAHMNIVHRVGDFLGSPVVKNLTSNAEDACSIPCWGTKIPQAKKKKKKKSIELGRDKCLDGTGKGRSQGWSRGIV